MEEGTDNSKEITRRILSAEARFIAPLEYIAPFLAPYAQQARAENYEYNFTVQPRASVGEFRQIAEDGKEAATPVEELAPLSDQAFNVDRNLDEMLLIYEEFQHKYLGYPEAGSAGVNAGTATLVSDGLPQIRPYQEFRLWTESLFVDQEVDTENVYRPWVMNENKQRIERLDTVAEAGTLAQVEDSFSVD